MPDCGVTPGHQHKTAARSSLLLFLNVRPLIIPDSWTIELEVHSRSLCYLVAIDGRSKVLDQTTKLRITKADYSIKTIKQLNHTFFDTLKNKLMWGVDKRN